MPELAEVETVRNTLKKRILNKKISDVVIIYDGVVKNDLDFFRKSLIGNEFCDILRIGKWLIFELNDYYLLSHLRMEGKYFIKNSNEPFAKHEHFIIRFCDNTDLRYHDVRKFGVIKIVKKEDLYNTEEIKKQGPEIISDNLTSEYLLEKFKKCRLTIKTALLSQDIISGIGNIYADEILFASFINPLKKACFLTQDECEKIILNGRNILNKAIEEGGCTIKSYTSSLGVIGNYQNYLKVHKKEGEKCPNCGNVIKRIKVGGRSTYYCDKCQDN